RRERCAERGGRDDARPAAAAAPSLERRVEAAHPGDEAVDPAAERGLHDTGGCEAGYRGRLAGQEHVVAGAVDRDGEAEVVAGSTDEELVARRRARRAETHDDGIRLCRAPPQLRAAAGDAP